MDGMPSSLELGLLVVACAFVLIPILQQVCAAVARWFRKKPDEDDVWSSRSY
jgi:hypothetical protein